MQYYIASDHAGFVLKNRLKQDLKKKYGFKDLGILINEMTDYPKIAIKLAKKVAKEKDAIGVLICGTGIGMSIVANRYKGVRAALCHNLYMARMSRMHNDANILVMGGRVIGVGLALEMVELFLKTPFEGGRHELRLDQID